jgi:hypothetical protein
MPIQIQASYRDVVERDGNLYVGDVFVGRPVPQRLAEEIATQLGLPAGVDYELRACRDYGGHHPYEVHRGCGAYFICAAILDTTWRCRACREQTARQRIAGTVARRSAARQLIRRNPICLICGATIQASRSTRKTCSSRCRQALRRRTLVEPKGV